MTPLAPASRSRPLCGWRAAHYVFRSNEEDVVRELRTFIDALPEER